MIHVPEDLHKVGELSNGISLYKVKNEAGGWSYFSESGGLTHLVFDECLSSKEELIAIAKDCYNLELRDKNEN
jgi:hypothetical protein